MMANVRELLHHNKVDVNLQMDGAWTPLIKASYDGHLEIVRELLQRNKVDANVKNKHGSTALDVARTEGHVDVVHLVADYTERVDEYELVVRLNAV